MVTKFAILVSLKSHEEMAAIPEGWLPFLCRIDLKVMILFPEKLSKKFMKHGALCIWISLQPWWEYIPIWAASSMRNERSCGWGKLITVKPNNVANLNQIFILSLVKNRMSKPSHFQRTWIQEEEKPNIKTRVVGYPRTACLVLATKDMFWTK